MASKMNFVVKKEELDGQDREKQETPHYFLVYDQSNRRSPVSCKMLQTVLEALKCDHYFGDLLKKNQGKEITIAREKEPSAYLAPHFPCSLLQKDDILTIDFGTGKMSKTPKEVVNKPKLSFYVDRTGGRNCGSKRIVKSQSMKNKNIKYLCVYGYTEETLEEALVRDGRFSEIVFKNHGQIFCQEKNLCFRMHSKLNDSLDGKIFRLDMEREGQANPLDSSSTVTDQAAVPQQEQGSESSAPGSETLALGSETAEPTEPPTDVRGDSTPRAGESAHAKPTAVYHPIPGTEEILEKLRSQFNDLVEHMKEREKVKGRKEVLDLLRVEFGKNIKVFWEVWKGKVLMEMSGSVGHLLNYISNNEGTGFLLFDRYVLTNAHVLKGDFSDANIHVNFRHDLRMETDLNLSIKGVVAQAYGWSDDGCYLDYALLELDENKVKDLPPPLLKWYCPSAEWGGICIIGHPEGGVKKFDLCSIIPFEQRESAVEKKKNIIQWMNWDFAIVGEDRSIITYDTCFFYGASGSPVFNVDCHLVGMHTGGYFSDRSGNSVIEYAISLQSILKDLLRKAVDSQNLDILTKFTEAARSQDSLHPLIADVIIFIGVKQSPDFWGCLQAIICVVESDVDSREHCWMNVIQSMSEVVRGGLRTWLDGVLHEAERNGLMLYQLLSGLSG